MDAGRDTYDAEGASVVLLDPDELAGRFPWLDVRRVVEENVISDGLPAI